MILRGPEEADLSTVVAWRNHPSVRVGLRTPFLVNEPMQRQWFHEVVCQRGGRHRYWAVIDTRMAAFAGLTNIEWENGIAEISLLTDPMRRGEGIGRAALTALLGEGFDRMRLLTIYGECYTQNPAIGFWRRMVEEFHGMTTTLPRRKFWDGQLHDSLYFTFTVEAWRDRNA